MNEHTQFETIEASRRDLLLLAASVTVMAVTPSLAFSAQGVSPTSFSNKSERTNDMGSLKTRDGTEIFYKDWGAGQPIVFHHGWPLSSDDWDTQVLSAPRSPWQRAYVERVIGTIRRECLDHLIVFNERSLHQHLQAFTTYYDHASLCPPRYVTDKSRTPC